MLNEDVGSIFICKFADIFLLLLSDGIELAMTSRRVNDRAIAVVT